MSLPPALLAIGFPVALFLAFWAVCTPLAGLVRALRAGARKASAWPISTRVGKWLVKHSGPLGSYAPILAVVIIGGVAALCAGYLFIDVAEQVDRATSVVAHADQAIHAWFGLERDAAMTTLFTGATAIGSTTGLVGIVSVVAAALLSRKDWASAIFVVVTSAIGALLNLGLKLIFERVRPDLTTALITARWYSFPSGHAMDTCITWGALTYVALRMPWPWKAKSLSLAMALTFVAMVGISRVYLGVHWASDIIGGWSAATVWLASTIIAFEMLLHLRQRRHIRRHGHPGEHFRPHRPHKHYQQHQPQRTEG